MFCTAWPEAPLVRLSSAAGNAGLRNTDEGQVGAPHMSRLRHFLKRQNMHERLVCVSLSKHGVEPLRRNVASSAHVDGGQNASVHRDEVRREAHDHSAPCRLGEFLVALGYVAMMTDAVGVNAFGHFGEQHLLF